MNSKKKGNTFERLISKKLSLWYSKGERDDLFYRTSNSGGRFTVRKKQNKDTANQHGDVCSYDSESELFSKFILLELKHYKDIDLWSIFTETKGNNIINWWKETIEESDTADKEPILITRQNNRPMLLVTTAKLSDALMKYTEMIPVIQIYSIEKNPCIFLFDDFMNTDSEKFKQILKEVFDK
jgi:hypothetical protein